MKYIILIGPKSPPLGGEALAFKMLYEHLLKKFEIKFVIIDKVYKQKKLYRRYINPIRTIFCLLRQSIVTRPSGVYFTAGQTFGGMLRDSFLIIICKALRVPVIVHLHGGGIKQVYDKQNKVFQKFFRYSYNNAKTIIILGNSLINQFHFINNPNKIKIVKNSLYTNTPKVTIDEIRFSFLKSPNLKIVFLSHVLPSKGLFLLLDALIILKKKGIRFQLNFGGDIIEESNHSKSKIIENIFNYKKFFSDQEFKILGLVSGEQKWKLLKWANIFVLPTKFYAEGQPISIIEAMYFGCVVLATNFRGIPDLIMDGVNGYFVDDSNPEDLAMKLISLQKDKDKMISISITNHIVSKKEYNSSIFLNKMTNILSHDFQIK